MLQNEICRILIAQKGVPMPFKDLHAAIINKDSDDWALVSNFNIHYAITALTASHKISSLSKLPDEKGEHSAPGYRQRREYIIGDVGVIPCETGLPKGRLSVMEFCCYSLAGILPERLQA